MLIIPYQTRFTAKSLPVVTLALVIINLLVYLLFQSGDRRRTSVRRSTTSGRRCRRSNCRATPPTSSGQ